MQIIPYLLLPHLISAAALGARNQDKRAVYFLDNNPSGSSIISLKISPNDGTLSNPVRTSTGGTGLFGLTASSTGGAPAAGNADVLFTQDSVVVSQDYLFTVNSGSNTVSMFFIDKNDPYHPRLIGKPAPTLGEFPAAVAYSSRLKTACVLNGGAIAGVTCYSTDHTRGLKPLGGLRPIPLGQTTPPVGPPNTVSDLVFNPSSTALIATVKGNGKDPGYIYAYPIHTSSGSISTTPIISRPAELLINFSISFLGDDSRAIITDPAYGASIVHISPNLEFTVTKKIPVGGEKAICWSVYSSRFSTAFIFDAGSTSITMVDPRTGNVRGTITDSGPALGSLDSAVDREFLYVLKGAPVISVIDNTGLNHGVTPRVVQGFGLGSLGSRQGFQGLAVYPS